MRFAMIAILYLFIAWAIHAATINPFTHLIGGGDGFIQGIASKTFATSFGSWNPYVQSGKFVFADTLYQSFYPPSLVILSILPNTFGFNLFLLVHYALAGLFMYFYLGSLRLTNFSAFVGGLVFMMCGFMMAHKGHEYIVCAAIWLPLRLHFIHRYAERLRILDLGYAAVPVGVLNSSRVSPDHALLNVSGNRLYSFLRRRFAFVARLESKARSYFFRGVCRAGNRLSARLPAALLGC